MVGGALAVFWAGQRRLDGTGQCYTYVNLIEAVIPIGEFREGRRLPPFALEMSMPIIEQYVQEHPLNQLDMPPEELPRTGEDMKQLVDDVSRYKKQPPRRVGQQPGRPALSGNVPMRLCFTLI